MPEASDDCLRDKLSLCDRLKVIPCLLFFASFALHPSNHNSLWVFVFLSFVHNIRQATAGGTDGAASDGWSRLWLPRQKHPCLQVLSNICWTNISWSNTWCCQIFLYRNTLLFMCNNFVYGHSNPDFEVFVGRDDVCFFISQSGETADTLGALR